MNYLLKERYQAIKPIGQGGFGKTFLAVDCDKPSKPPCVIKQFSPSSQGTNSLEKAEELFNKEAARLENLGKHPQIPELLAHFEQDQQLYLIQEYIDGQNLAEDLAENGVWDETAIKELLIGLLPVLKFVHDNNLIHRDIKPENIIQKSEDKTFVLVDFGAARYVTGTALLKTGTIIGDPRYMSDEQLRGKTVFSSDLYSLGLTCLHLLTNIDPWDLYDGNEGEFIWRNYLTNPINEEFGEILDKMIEKPIKKRFQNAEEILSILQPSQTAISSELDLLKSPEVVYSKKENKETKTDITVEKNSISQSNPVVNIELTPVRLGGLWGYIDATGKVVISPQFERAETFIEGLAKIRVNDKYGYINQSGKIVIPAEFDESGDFIDGLAKIEINDKYGYIDQSGKMIIQPNYDRIDDFRDGLAKFRIDWNYGYIDKKGKIVIKPWFSELGDFSDDLAMIYADGEYGYIDKKGNIVIKPQFQKVSDFSDGLAAVKIHEKWGFINKLGSIVIDPQFDEMYDFSDNLLEIEQGGKYGLIDKKGDIVIEPQFDHIGNLCGNFAQVEKDKKYGLINEQGYIVIEPQFDEIDKIQVQDEPFINRFRKIRVAPKNDGYVYGLIDSDDNIVLNVKFDEIIKFTDSLAIIEKDTKYGFIDRNGNIVINPNFDEIGKFVDGFARIKDNKIYGFIDTKGKIVIKPKFNYARNFYEGLAAVKIDEKYGYIDKRGNIVIEPQFEQAKNFKNGQAYVEKKRFLGMGTRKGYIDKTGEWIE
ncbi:MAG: WG repeat-containing protein [Crocosphaera sp.]